MAAPHTATIFLSHDEANMPNRHQVAFNEEGTREAFDGTLPLISRHEVPMTLPPPHPFS